MIIKACHLRLMKPIYCVDGTKLWLERHGLSWKQFCKEGIDSEVILATGDLMGIKLVEAVQWAQDHQNKR